MPTQPELQARLSTEAWGQLAFVLSQLQQNLSGQLNVRSLQTKARVLRTREVAGAEPFSTANPLKPPSSSADLQGRERSEAR